MQNSANINLVMFHSLISVIVILTLISTVKCETKLCSSFGTCTCTEDNACILQCMLHVFIFPKYPLRTSIYSISGTSGKSCGGDGESSTLNCRDGYPCLIVCSGERACGGDQGQATVNCNAATTCTMQCIHSESCGDRDGRADLNCGSSACSLEMSGTSSDGGMRVNTIPGVTQSYQCTGSCGSVGGDAPFTADPSSAPTSGTTSEPTTEPTKVPSSSPSKSPSKKPTESPTKEPSSMPTLIPSYDPSLSPSIEPTDIPSTDPTMAPSKSPTDQPSPSPSHEPSESPTAPTLIPSRSPLAFGQTHSPSYKPSVTPTTPYPVLQIADTPTVRQSNEGSGSIQGEPTASIASNVSNINVDKSGIEDWVYVIIGCSSLICCLAGSYMLY